MYGSSSAGTHCAHCEESAPKSPLSPCKRAHSGGHLQISKKPGCEFPGCASRGWESSPGKFHRFCGIMHHDMYTAYLHASSVQGAKMGRNTCKLPECSKPVRIDKSSGRVHDFCGKSHVLEYIKISTARYHELGRICKMEGCYRHVYVENERIHDYCGFRHAKEAAAAEGFRAKLRSKLARKRNSEETHSYPDPDSGPNFSDWDMVRRPSSSPSSEAEEKPSGANEPRNIQSLSREDHLGHSGFEEKIPEFQLNNFLEGVQTALSQETSIKQPWFYRAKSSLNIYQGANIYDYHPWELLTEPKPRYFLAVTTKQQTCSRHTKEGHSWKQTGCPHPRKRARTLETRYFTYQKKSRGKKRDTSAKDDRPKKWVLHQYSLKDKGHAAKACLWKVVIYKMEDTNPEMDTDGLSATPTQGSDSTTTQPAIIKYVESPTQQLDASTDEKDTRIMPSMTEGIQDTQVVARPPVSPLHDDDESWWGALVTDPLITI